MTTAGYGTAYDNVCKKLLANRMVLAWIMKSCMEEYRDCPVQEIAEMYIEKEPEISNLAVHSDEILQIKGINTEDTSIMEGTVVYDIKYQATAPGTGGLIRLIISVEAQNDFYPGYPVIMRSIYYCSRMISSQYGTEFTQSHYEKIKKVYCIFICANPPKHRKNTINRYCINEECLAGEFHEKKERYQLLTSVMICLGDTDDPKATGILRLLEVLLSHQRDPETKKKILQEEFGIPMTSELEGEVTEMCNLSKGLITKGLQEGIQQGIQQGVQQGIQQGIRQTMLQNIQDLMSSMNWTAQQTMDALKIPREEQEKYADKIK